MITSKRIEERKKGLYTLKTITEQKNNTIIIHYSCESFITNHGKTPRITSICVRHLSSSQTKSFSIHLQAEIKKMDLNNISDSQYDECEKLLLREYFDFAKSHKKSNRIHWNMRDTSYGFEAINIRAKILGVKTEEISDEKKYDLPRIISEIYTHKYEKNEPCGRLLNLAQRNNISTKGALKGSEEGNAFTTKKFLELHISTLRKVDIIDSILDRVYKNELKTMSGTTEIYGLSIDGLKEIIANNIRLSMIYSLIIRIIGIISTPYITKLINIVQSK